MILFRFRRCHNFKNWEFLWLDRYNYTLSTTMEKMVFLNFAASWGRAFGFKIFI